MNETRFIIKNYRCFSDEHPLEFALRNGFTAFIGPNNSGKSTILRFFYEFRSVWQYLSTPGQLHTVAQGGNVVTSLSGVIGTGEVFCKFNNRDIEISIDIEGVNLRFYVRREGANNVRINGGEVYKKGQLLEKPQAAPEMQNSHYADFFQVLRDMMYVPAFRNAINVGSGEDYYNIKIGEGFIKDFAQHKLGVTTADGSQTVINVIKDIKKIFGYNNLEINPTDDRKSLHFNIDGKVYRLHEIGSGIAQFILVFVSAALKKPSFILIDEPESNLHPSLQLKFLTKLASYSKNGVLFATHSLGLARSSAEDIYSVVKKDNDSLVRPFEQTSNYAQLLGELNFSAYQELGVNKILLVEGVNEIKTFQQFLRKLNKDKDFVILNLGGKNMINGRREYELNEIKRICSDIYCIIDSEKGSADSSLPKDREEFVDVCKKLGIRVLPLQRRAIENYLTEEAIRKVKGGSSRALEYYEKLDSNVVRWDKHEIWRIADEMNFEEIKDTDLGQFLSSI